MNAINYNANNWVEPILLTGAPRAFALVALVVVANLASTNGTGSTNDITQIKNRSQNGNNYWISVVAPQVETHAATECLARIRNFFSPSVSDLAATLGVSRQTVYNWQNGDQPKEVLAEKLNDLANAADVFVQSDIQFNSTLARRKFVDGKTLFQVVESNNSATEAAKLLVRILETEARQRKVLEARFANRPKTAPSSDFDLPLANDPA